ncbi:MAG TPA: putative lipid II flippase FtsW [Baekduia sp.]|nr:putative lipid II flippase FtsW [Baekduia sp.]
MAGRQDSQRRKAESQSIESSILLTATFCLLAGGAVMVFSASSARAVLLGTGDPTQFLMRYVIYGAFGLGLMWFMSRRPLKTLPRLAGPLLAVAFVCLLLVFTPLGVEVNGAKRWLGAGFITFQPSELMKLALILYSVSLLSERPDAVFRPKKLMPMMIVAGAACLLILAQPDLGTVLVIAFTLTMLLVAAGLPMKFLVRLGAGGAGLVTLFAMSASYRRDRLMTFLHPWDHARDEGFQSVQGLIALGSGGPFGQGLGQGQAKNLFLPEAHTDFILANVGEELGVVGILVLLVLYGMIAYAGLRIAKSAKRPYEQLLAAGVTSLILCQAILNTFTVLGLAPLTGVPLPFISYGSTNLVVLLISVGLLLNVARGQTAAERRPLGFPDEVAAFDMREVKESQRAEHRDRSGGNSRARGAVAGSRRRP